MRRHQQFRAGVFPVLIMATTLVVGVLSQGCRTQQPAAAGAAAPGPVVSRRILTPRAATSPSSAPMNSNADINWPLVAPASQPENAAASVPPPPQTLPPAPESVPPQTLPLAPEPLPPQTTPLAPGPLPTPAVHKTSARHSAAGVYVVKSGDTLARIARAHHTTVRAIKVANHLKSDRILVGEKLKLPPARAGKAHH